jgi:hypothetical protein
LVIAYWELHRAGVEPATFGSVGQRSNAKFCENQALAIPDFTDFSSTSKSLVREWFDEEFASVRPITN